MEDHNGEQRELALAVGQAIAKRRRARGLTQEQLSEAAGLAQASLSHIERGVSAPSLERLSQLATLLGCRLVDFFGEAGTAPADRAVRIHEKLLALTAVQQDALERLLDEAITMVTETRSPAKKRTKKTAS
ncbi:helix-turn-helix domain-containing protein [Paraburkholderia sp. BCC1885]|uniref:helix-turn-helix domain-containing protein n=1 Tax=Paraburkholderia sp. BCC1885 TaxID=2562669 RepID=UPI0021B393F8|nr:helix-turn-helix transcriptional regulator [Paraburkholderia sp. BCC1885]